MENLNEDRIRGVKKIAQHINESERRTFHLLKQRLIPGFKEGNSWVSLKSKLNQHHREKLGGG